MKGEFCGNLLCFLLNSSWKHSKYLMIYQKQSGNFFWRGGNFANIDRQEAKFMLFHSYAHLLKCTLQRSLRESHTHIHTHTHTHIF